MKSKISILTGFLIFLTIVSFSNFGYYLNQIYSFDYGSCLDRYTNIDSGIGENMNFDSIGYMLEICPQEREDLYQYKIIFQNTTIIILLLTILSWKIDNLKNKN